MKWVKRKCPHCEKSIWISINSKGRIIIQRWYSKFICNLKKEKS